MQPNKLAHHTVRILTGRKCDFQTYVAPWSLNQICCRGRGVITKFVTLPWNTSSQSFFFFFFFYVFCTLCKIHYKTQIHTSIKLKFNTLKGAHLSTNFGGNLIKSYYQLLKSNFCCTYRVNCYEELIENCSVFRLTIIGVPFGGLRLKPWIYI